MEVIWADSVNIEEKHRWIRVNLEKLFARCDNGLAWRYQAHAHTIPIGAIQLRN